MFGKSLSEYVAFQKPILMLITAVWALRLLFSMAGMPVSGAQFVSVTGMLVVGALYYGWAVGKEGFGSFKQLYGLNLIQGLYSQTLVALAILLAMAIGQDNIYTLPEFYPPSKGNDSTGLPPDGKNLGHAVAHIVVGIVLFPIIGWLLGSVVHLATRKSKRPASA